MHIAICNERLIFRFGVDRILLMLGQAMAAAGHRVSLVCLRHDEEARSFGAAIHVAKEAQGLGIYEAEQAANAALEEVLARSDDPVDALVIGGWPYFSATGLAKKYRVPTVFIDAGAVPHDGVTGGALEIQRAVRRLRSVALPKFDVVLPISDFICESQTVPERGGRRGVEVVRLGVDHLERAIFGARDLENSSEHALLTDLEARSALGVPLILALGRFEAEGYKNSREIFDVFAAVRARKPESLLLLLGTGDDIAVPKELAEHVVFLGFASDALLARVMEIASLGLSMSLWEGFNLPMGEMQYAGKPVIAFNVGAHPEVIAHPWYLASSAAEMASKALSVIEGRDPGRARLARMRSDLPDTFRWRHATSRYLEIIQALVERKGPAPKPPRAIFVDVSNSARDPANSGVTRVARQVCARLQMLCDFDLVFIAWSSESKSYRLLTPHHRPYLEGHGGPRDFFTYQEGTGHAAADSVPNIAAASVRASGCKPVLFLPEIAMDGEAPDRIAWARAHGFAVAAILYDLIPVNHPEFCDPKIVGMFPAYLDALTTVDAISCISETTRADYISYVNAKGRMLASTPSADLLPGQFGTMPRRKSMPLVKDPAQPRKIVCVSTIEPRKNHRTLIEAFRRYVARAGASPVELVLIGNRYADAPDLARYVEESCVAEPRIRWMGVLADEAVAHEIEASDFVVYPSLVEGFGLPIVEALWLGKPCLCHNGGVMAELAAAGGCVTADMRSVGSLVNAFERLLENGALLNDLQNQIRSRPLMDWDDYVGRLASILYHV